MKNIKKYALMSIGLILALSIFAFALPKAQEGIALLIQDVFVTNTAANPVPVSDVNAKTQTPYQFFITVSVDPGVASKTVYYSLPAGKMFVAEHISFEGNAATGQTVLYSVLTHISPNPTYYQTYLPVLSKSIAGTFDYFSGGQDVKLYANTSSFGAKVSRPVGSATTGYATGTFTVVGYLIDE